MLISWWLNYYEKVILKVDDLCGNNKPKVSSIFFKISELNKVSVLLHFVRIYLLELEY